MAAGLRALPPDLIVSIVKRGEYESRHSCALTCSYLAQSLRGLFGDNRAADQARHSDLEEHNSGGGGGVAL